MCDVLYYSTKSLFVKWGIYTPLNDCLLVDDFIACESSVRIFFTPLFPPTLLCVSLSDEGLVILRTATLRHFELILKSGFLNKFDD